MEKQAKKRVFVKAKVDHRLAPEYITMTVFQQEQHERNLPNQKIFQHKDQGMIQTLHQSNASKSFVAKPELLADVFRSFTLGLAEKSSKSLHFVATTRLEKAIPKLTKTLLLARAACY